MTVAFRYSIVSETYDNAAAFAHIIMLDDCPDLDSIHNDGERHIPYIMFFPDGTRSKLAAWAGNQGADGMLAEQILNSRPDSPQGRIMSDSSSMFILYILELLYWNGDETTAQLYYPVVKKAAQWQISKSQDYDVPLKLETTYDILRFPVLYQLSTYASAFHIAALRAAETLAEHAGDQAFASECRTAYTAAQDAIDKLQWNETAKVYNAGSNGCIRGKRCDEGIGIFSDSFYAQVLAYSLWGSELIVNGTRLDLHLNSTLQTLCKHTEVQGGQGSYELVPGCPNGLITMQNRPVELTDLQVWEMGTYNQAALMIRRSLDADRAKVQQILDFAAGTGTSYSNRLNDQWNIAGIKSNDGYPTVTSHYGYHMTAWHIPLALSGQQARLHPHQNSQKNQTHLSFSPKLPCDIEGYVLPLYLPGVLGTLSCQDYGGSAGQQAAVELTVGSLRVDILSVDGVSYPTSPVHLGVGNQVKWVLK